MKANFKVPHATSNEPKKSHQGSDLCEISNYASRASSFPKKFVKLLILFSAGTYVPSRITHARAGIKGGLEQFAHYRRWERRSRTGAGGGQADSGRGAAEQDWSWRRTSGLGQRSGGGRSGAGGGQAAGGRTGRTQTVQWSWRRTSGPRQYSGAEV